jgi:prepilin-type N-terminal cleavage/methylation domain-containing protein
MLSQFPLRARWPLQKARLLVRKITWLGRPILATINWLSCVEVSMDGSLLSLGKSYCLYRLRQNRSAALLRVLPSHQQSMFHGGFTLVEMLAVVVILGLLSAVGIPAYFAQTRSANINSANLAVLAAAKACAAAQVASDTGTFSPGRGVVIESAGRCGAESITFFRSDSATFTLTNQARASADSSTGVVTLVASAS